MATIKQTAAALALGLAASATAQAPAPAPSQPSPQAGAPAPLTQEQKTALGAVWIHNQLQAGLGDVAATRGSSGEVKSFARWISKDHKTLASQIWGRLQERGTSPSTLPSPPERQQLEQEAKQLAARSGDDFDRALVTFMKQHGPEFVDALKHARDVTAGSDSVLKKFLDQAEDAQEEYLTAARQLDARRAQARTPPAR